MKLTELYQIAEAPSGKIKVYRGIKDMPADQLSYQLLDNAKIDPLSKYQPVHRRVSKVVDSWLHKWWTTNPNMAFIYASTNNPKQAKSQNNLYDVLIVGLMDQVVEPKGKGQVVDLSNTKAKIFVTQVIYQQKKQAFDFNTQKDAFTSLIESRIGDLNIRTEFEETTEDGDNVVLLNFFDIYSDKKLGTIKAVEYPDIGVYMVKRSRIDSESLRGKGLGLELYVILNDYIKKEKKMKLASDIFRSQDADGLWTSLKSKGLANGPVDYTGIKTKEPLMYYVMEDASGQQIDLKKINVKAQEYDRKGKKSCDFTIRLLAKPIGIVKTSYDPDADAYMIRDAQLNSGYTHKGIGFVAYKQINDYLKQKLGKNLASDIARTDSAEGLWKKMASQGLASGPNQYSDDSNFTFYKMESVWDRLDGLLK